MFSCPFSLSLSLCLSLPLSPTPSSTSTSLSFPGYPSSQVNLEHKWIKGELRSLCKVKPFQISAQMKGGPAHTCAHTHSQHLPTCIPPHLSLLLLHTHTLPMCICSRYASVDLWMSVSVCWECLSSPCFWAWCQAQLPAVLGQGNTMALNVAHHPPSILYQLGKKSCSKRGQRSTHFILQKTYRNSPFTHRYTQWSGVCEPSTMC